MTLSSRILLIEDDEFLSQLYKDILEGEKYTVVTSANGIDAYEKILENTWDLVLLDVMLPGMKGTEIMKKLKDDKDFIAKSPIIFLTNMDGGSDINKLTQLADGCWIKSNLTPPEFVEKVKNILK